MSIVSPCPAGVPQGPVILPTLFNVYVNDVEDSIPNSLAVNTHKYADDCTLDESVKEGDVSNMQEVLNGMQTWADHNKMTLNSKKAKHMWICFRDCIPEPPPLSTDGELIERTKSFKLLGVRHQNTLKWNDHIMEITKKANRRMFCLRECRRAKLPTEVGIACYTTKIRPMLEYGSPIWGGIPQYLVSIYTFLVPSSSARTSQTSQVCFHLISLISHMIISTVNRYGRQFLNSLFSFALKIWVSRAIFRLSGILPVRKVKSDMRESGSEISLPIVFITCEHYTIITKTLLGIQIKLFILISNLS